jgi:3-oxoacyl-[acyl-carrier-protein] synthase II
MESRRISSHKINPVRKHKGRVIPHGAKAVVVSCNMVTAYGYGVDTCWQGILSGKTAVSILTRFNTRAFQSDYAAEIKGLKYLQKDSLVMQMLKVLFSNSSISIPEDSMIILATTKGEIDILEKNLLKGIGDASKCNLNYLLKKVLRLTRVKGGGIVISAACASSAAAVARAAAMIRSGQKDCILVIACDSITEFIFSGFSSLMALDRLPARPFDKDRAGLSLGEAAAYALMMSKTRAKKERREILGEIAGWGLSDDANHMTGPSRTGDGLVLAIKKAVKTAGINETDIDLISAHGTGTVYNDAMEIKAFNTVLKGKKRPVYSLKGGVGHTMGASGLLELNIAFRALKEKIVPPTVNLKEADRDADGWVSTHARVVRKSKNVLITNAGFSGINAALILSV